MNEIEWAKSVQTLISAKLAQHDDRLVIRQGSALAYANEVLLYRDKAPVDRKTVAYETDLLVTEDSDDGTWKPRVVIECKIMNVSTHDAITYSEKAAAHKRVHPYLRYGILLGNRAHYPLPGRLYRHGLYFDFMLSWIAETPNKKELGYLMDVLIDEVEASRNLEEMLYNSQRMSRNRYIVLHKPLRLKK